MDTTIGADAAKLAGLQIDLLQKIRNGQITVGDLEWFNRLTAGDRNRLKSGLYLPNALPIFKTIDLGTYRTDTDLYNALARERNRVGTYANQMMNGSGFKVSRRKTQVDLVVLTTAELTGKKEGGTTAEVLAGAKRLHLQKCSPEVGPQLRLQYKDQPMNEWLLIGMDPIKGSDGRLEVFFVGRSDDGLWLSSSYGSPGGFWGGGSRWVFARSK